MPKPSERQYHAFSEIQPAWRSDHPLEARAEGTRYRADLIDKNTLAKQGWHEHDITRLTARERIELARRVESMLMFGRATVALVEMALYKPDDPQLQSGIQPDFLDDEPIADAEIHMADGEIGLWVLRAPAVD